MTSPASPIINAVPPIQLSSPSVVNSEGMSFMSGTSPCTINYNNNLYIFFNGSGADGVWYTNSADAIDWTSVNRAAGLPIASGASPAAAIVPWSNRLFLFANSNSGVLFVTTTDLVNWTAPQTLPGVSILGTTNPSVVSFNGSLYIFFNGSGSNGIFSAAITESNGQLNLPNQITVGPSFLDIMNGTSPCAVVYGTQIFLFYISAGPSGLATGTTTPSTATSDYLVFFTSSSNGSNWSAPQQIGSAASPGSSPAAIVAGPNPSSTGLYLLWPTDTSLTMAYTFNGVRWELPGSFVVNQNPGTSTSATNLGTTPYIFWTGPNGPSGSTSLGCIDCTFTPLIPVSDFLVASINASYIITNSGTAAALDASSGTPQLNAPTGSAAQQWQLIYCGGNQFCLSDRSTNNCIGVDTTGASIIMSAYSGAEAQMWQFVTPTGNANAGASLLYNSLNGVYLSAQGTQLVLAAAGVVDAFHQWLFSATNTTTLQVFNQNAYLSTVSFYLASSAGQYIAIGQQLDAETYAIVSVQATDTAAIFTINDAGVFATTAPNGSPLYLGEAAGDPVFAAPASSLTASFMLFNDELTYISLSNGNFLSLDLSSSQGALLFQPSQFFEGAGFDVIPEAIVPGADLSLFSLPQEALVTKVDLSQLDPCTIAWIQFVWQCTGGFFMAVGLLPSVATLATQSSIYNSIVGNPTVSSAAEALVTFINNNPKVSAALFISVNEFLIQMYEQGLLLPILKSIAVNMGFFGLLWVIKKIIIFIFMPGAQVPEMIVGFISWGFTLYNATSNLNSSCSSSLSLSEGELPKLIPSGAA